MAKKINHLEDWGRKKASDRYAQSGGKPKNPVIATRAKPSKGRELEK